MLNHKDIPRIKHHPKPAPRLGFFHVSRIIVEEHWDLLLLIMPHVVPLEVIYRAEVSAYRYLVHSELFEPTERGVVPPEYDVIVSEVPGAEGDEPTRTFEFKRRTGFSESLW